MAIQQFGDNSYKFGFSDADAITIAAAVGLVPQEGTFGVEPEVKATGTDRFNRTVAMALDDQGKRTLSLNGYVNNAVLFEAAIGTTFTYKGLVYITVGRELSVKKDEFQMGSLTAENYSQITSGAKTLVAA